jgi:hypothetical protein
MGSQDLLARFRQSYGEEYADLLTADWGPPPHVCPFCLTPTLRKLLLGDPTHKVGNSIWAKWYMWCDKCLRGIYCPPGTYAVPPGKPYVRWGDEAAIESALPAGLKLIHRARKAVVAAESEPERVDCSERPDGFQKGK